MYRVLAYVCVVDARGRRSRHPKGRRSRTALAPSDDDARAIRKDVARAMRPQAFSSSDPSTLQRDLYFIAEQPAPAPHLAHTEGRAALTYMC